MESHQKKKTLLTFGVLLNLVSASNADNEEVLWKFIQNFAPDTDRSKYPILNQLVKNAISYFNDHVKIHKKYRNANEQKKRLY